MSVPGVAVPIPTQSVRRNTVFVPVHQTLEPPPPPAPKKVQSTERATLLVLESLLSTMGTISTSAKSSDDVIAVSSLILTFAIRTSYSN